MPKILLYDLETSPLLGYSWGIYEQNILKVVEDPYILCFAYKWLGEKNTRVIALSDFKRYKRDKKNDVDLVGKLYDLIDEADIVIGQNSDKFDNKWANKQFIKHGLNPVSPYKSIDTLKIAKRYFRFEGNSLDRLGEFLGLGRKVKHSGIDLWFRVMDGDKKAWKEMITYARQDVVLLEQIYNKLKPWMDTHPNLNQYNEQQELKCPVCQSYNLRRRGWREVGKRSRARSYRCYDCGKWSQGKTQIIQELTIS